MGLVLSTGCAKAPVESSAPEERVVPLPTEIDGIDSSKLVPSDKTQNCRKAPALATAAKNSEEPLVKGGFYGTYDWAAGKTNGGQLWKTRLAYVKSSLAQMRIMPSFSKIGNVSTQVKLAQKDNSDAYINGDFFQLRGTNLLYSAMVYNNELVYAPSNRTEIVGVVEEPANEHTGIQGKSFIKASGVKIEAQGLNLVYLAADAVGVYNNLKTTTGLPEISYVVKVTDGVVTSSEPATAFSIPKDSKSLVIVGRGSGTTALSALKKGDSVTYEAPNNATTTRFLRTGLRANGSVVLPSGKSISIRGVNHDGIRASKGVVLFTQKLFSKTSKLGATVVTDLDGNVLSFYKSGRAVTVKPGQYVLQVGSAVAKAFAGLKVGSKLTINNTFAIKKKLPLAAAFGDRENTMINGVIVADCSPGHEDIRPRTAIGWNENGDVWFATTTMGVRNSADIFNRFRVGGSTVHQLTAWLKQLGATQAVSVDGGGSTTMYVKQPSNKYLRLDLPATEWVRTVPQGITMVAR